MYLDIHAHLYPDAYARHLERMGGESEALAKRLDAGAKRSRFMAGAVEERIELLDELKIDRQVLTLTSQFVQSNDVERCREHARAANNILAEICARYPKRLSIFANLPLVDGDSAVAEMDRAVKECRAVGVTFPTHILGRPLDWPGLEPVYAALEERELPIFLHPGPPWHAVTPPGYKDYSLTSALYFPTEDANAVLRMVLSGVLERYPRLRVICPHLGGSIPFLFRRYELHTDPQMPDGSPLPHPPSYYLKKIKYDVVSQHLPAVRCACETLGVSQLVFGTDFPYVQPPGIRETEETVEQLEVSDAERKGIEQDNVAAWLRF